MGRWGKRIGRASALPPFLLIAALMLALPVGAVEEDGSGREGAFQEASSLETEKEESGHVSLGRPADWLLVGLFFAVLLSLIRWWKLPNAKTSSYEGPVPISSKGAAGRSTGDGDRGSLARLQAPRCFVDAALLLFVLLLALLPRLVHLDSRPMEADEGAVLGPLPGPTRWASEDCDARFKPPLHPQISRLATGQTSDLLAVRIVSLLAGLVTVGLVAILAFRRGGREAAVVAGLLVALCVDAVFVSGLARSYALLGLTVLIAHMALMRAVSRGGWAWDLYALAAAAAMLTDYLALGPVLAGAAVVALGVRRPMDVRLACAMSLGSALALVAFVVPVTLPYLLGGAGFSPGPTVPEGPLAALGVMARVVGGVAPWLGVLALAAGIAFPLFWPRAKGGFGLNERCLLAAAAGVLAIALLGSYVESVRPRYVTHVIPLLAVVFATSITRLSVFLRLPLAAVLLVSHGWLTVDKALLGCNLHKACNEPPLPSLTARAAYEQAEREPTEPLAVWPRSRLDDTLYRLHRLHPGRESRHRGQTFPLGPQGEEIECPAVLCFPTPEGAVYGIDGRSDLEAIVGHHETALLLVDEREVRLVWSGCRLLEEESGHGLYRCRSER